MFRTTRIVGKVRAVRPVVLLAALSKQLVATYGTPRAVVVSEHEVHFLARAVPGVFAIRATVLLQSVEDGLTVKVTGTPIPEAGAYVLFALQLAAACDLFLVAGSGLRSLIPLVALMAGTVVLHGRTTRSLTRATREVMDLYR